VGSVLVEALREFRAGADDIQFHASRVLGGNVCHSVWGSDANRRDKDLMAFKLQVPKPTPAYNPEPGSLPVARNEAADSLLAD
jgi:hypothetical protein